MRRRLAVLISGRGSNLGAILRAAAAPDYPARVVLVLCDREGAAGLDLAASAGVATALVASSGHPRAEFEARMQAALEAAGAEFVALAGFMRVLSAGFTERWAGRMANIHPSLLPAFPGLDTHRRALAAGVRVHGCTVHLVTPGVDEGPILAQAAVPVLAGDDEHSLAARVLRQEHRLYPAALAALVRGAALPDAPAEAVLSSPLPAAPAVPTHGAQD